MCQDTLAEWLRRRPAKPLGFARVGSNPTGVVIFLHSRFQITQNWLKFWTQKIWKNTVFPVKNILVLQGQFSHVATSRLKWISSPNKLGFFSTYGIGQKKTKKSFLESLEPAEKIQFWRWKTVFSTKVGSNPNFCQKNHFGHFLVLFFFAATKIFFGQKINLVTF